MADTNSPRRHEEGLILNRSGQWRYRVGNDRILAETEDKELIVLAIEAGYRNSVYKVWPALPNELHSCFGKKPV